MLSEHVPSTSSVSSTTNSTTPISTTSAPSKPIVNENSDTVQKNDHTFSAEEIRYLESVLKVMKWNEQKTNELRQLAATNGRNRLTNGTNNEQDVDLIAHYFNPDSNGNPFPYMDFINSLNIPNSFYRT